MLLKDKNAPQAINSAQVWPNFIGTGRNEELAQQANESKTQIQRYIRLNDLIPSLLSQVDHGTLKFGNPFPD